MASKIKENVYIQSLGRETNVNDVIARAKEAFINDGHRASEIKTISVYLKTEDDMAYYVVNDDFTDGVPLYSQ